MNCTAATSGPPTGQSTGIIQCLWTNAPTEELTSYVWWCWHGGGHGRCQGNHWENMQARHHNGQTGMKPGCEVLVPTWHYISEDSHSSLRGSAQNISGPKKKSTTSQNTPLSSLQMFRALKPRWELPLLQWQTGGCFVNKRLRSKTHKPWRSQSVGPCFFLFFACIVIMSWMREEDRSRDPVAPALYRTC